MYRNKSIPTSQTFNDGGHGCSSYSYRHKLECERIHFLLIDEVSRGLDDITAARVKDARTVLTAMKHRRQK